MLDHTELLGQRLRSLLTGTGNSPGTLPSMPCTASLSQHALHSLAIPACPGGPHYPSKPWRPHHPGMPRGPYSIITSFTSSYLQSSLILSLSLLYYFPKYRGQNVIFEADVHLKKKKLLVIQPVKLI